MKIHIIILISLLCVCKTHAQYSAPLYYDVDKYATIDSAAVKCTYKLVSVKDTLHSDDQYTDIQVLLIGNKFSSYYSQRVLDYNEKMAPIVHKGAQGIEPNTERGCYAFCVYCNQKSRQLTVTSYGVLNDLFYAAYPDSLQDLQWQIGSAKKTILGYSCQEANVSFRGRQWTAWFTNDIPIPEGPWKLKGLPGLILSANDAQNYFQFTCIGLENLQVKVPIKRYSFKENKVTREEYAKREKRYHANTFAYERSTGRKTLVMGRDGKFRESVTLSAKVPYNPIEKE